MICKIQPPNPDVESAVKYNERKMNSAEGIRDHETAPELRGIEDGHILATRNVPEGSTLIDEFRRLKTLSMRERKSGPAIRNTSFHMSVNPSETDTPLDEATAVKLIDEIMTGLGYKDQPYRIYKHTDIARTHYHVVSTRIGQDGKRVNADWERLKLRDILKGLSERYGFSVVLSEDEMMEEIRKGMREERKISEAKERKGPARPDPEKRKPVPPFSKRRDTPVREQMREAIEDSMSWSLTTFEQYQALMLRRYRLLVEIERDGDGERLKVSGTDAKGNPITPLLSEDEIGVGLLRWLRDKTENERMGKRRSQRDRLERLAEAATEAAGSYGEFVKIMEEKGVYTVISWTRDGEPFGVTWLDRATRCAWKGSETARDLAWLKETAKEKGWTIEEGRMESVARRRSEAPSRKRDQTRKEEPEIKAGTGSGRGNLLNDLRKVARSAGSGGQATSTVRGRKKDLLDEAEEEKLREERMSGEID